MNNEVTWRHYRLNKLNISRTLRVYLHLHNAVIKSYILLLFVDSCYLAVIC